MTEYEILQIAYFGTEYTAEAAVFNLAFTVVTVFGFVALAIGALVSIISRS